MIIPTYNGGRDCRQQFKKGGIQADTGDSALNRRSWESKEDRWLSFQAEYQKGETCTDMSRESSRNPVCYSLTTDQHKSLRKLPEGEERTNQNY